MFFEDGEETAYLGVLLLDLGVLLFDAFVEELDLGSEDIGAVGIILAVIDVTDSLLVVITNNSGNVTITYTIGTSIQHISLPCQKPLNIQVRKILSDACNLIGLQALSHRSDKRR